MLAKEARKTIEAAFKPFFQQYGEFYEFISWYQFTPYYADGDQCEFSYCSFLDADSTSRLKEPCPPESEAMLDTLDDQLQDIESILLTAFGDHQVVTVSAEGITSEKFDHH